MQAQRRILIIDNDPVYSTLAKEWFELEQYEVFTATSLNEAKQLLHTTSVHLIITDVRVTDDADDKDISGLIFAREFAPAIPKIILTSYPSYEAVLKALRPDSTHESLPIAFDFIAKGEGLERLSEAVAKAFQQHVLVNYPQFKVGGALTDDDAAVYIARQAEQEVITYTQRMDYLLIIEPRQQGKTSLINFLVRSPELMDTVFVYVDVATTDRSNLTTWYETLCIRVLDQLNRIFSTNVQWPSIPRTNVQWRSFLSGLAVFFESTHKYLVIALDEIGTTIPDATGFFNILRDVFNSRQTEPHFKRLTFLLVGAFHPRDLVKDDKVSPFNIARRVRLPDFTLEQTWSLVSGITCSNEEANILAAKIYYWVSGQPYLTQQLCTYLRSGASPMDVDDAVERLRREDENHLPPLLKRINANESLRVYVDQILAGEQIKFYPAENQTQAQLELLGVITLNSSGDCVVRNRIYEVSLVQTERIDRLYIEPIGAHPMGMAGSRQHNTLTQSSQSMEVGQSSPISLAERKGDIKVAAMTTILFLASDPSDASRLRLAQELRDIQEKLQMAAMRDKFNLKQRMSVRPVDISQAILDEEPRIVHFSGHGTSAGELCFEDELGRAKTVNPEALGALFELVAEHVDCVLMNACFSAVQADAIARHIKHVIGMSKEIGDKAAISFAIGFYQALGAGKSIEEAYKFGCVQIRLQGIPEHLTPVLLNMK